MALVTTKERCLMLRRTITQSAHSMQRTWRWFRPSSLLQKELRAPVIVQTTPGTLKVRFSGYVPVMVAAAASEATVPVVMHLDHGSSYELAMKAFRAGYTSVIIDGSHHVSRKTSRSPRKLFVPAMQPASLWKLWQGRRQGR